MTPHTRSGAPARVAGRVLRVVVAVGLTAWLLSEAELAAVGSSLARATPGWVAAAVGLVLCDRALNAYRWLLLLRAIDTGRAVGFGSVMRVFLASTFLGSFLPGSVGGDAVRALAVSRLDVPRPDALASVVVDRLVGIVSILLTAAAGLFMVRDLFDGRTLVALAGVSLAIVGACLLLVFDSRVLSGLVRWLAAGRWPTVHRLSEKALVAIRQYGRHRAALATVLVVSIAVQALRILQAWCLGQALGLDVGLAAYAAFVPVAVLIILLPLSISGLGTGQAAFQVLFATVGVAAPDALALSFLFLGLGYVGNLPGGLVVAFGRRGRG